MVTIYGNGFKHIYIDTVVTKYGKLIPQQSCVKGGSGFARHGCC